MKTPLINVWRLVLLSRQDLSGCEHFLLTSSYLSKLSLVRYVVVTPYYSLWSGYSMATPFSLHSINLRFWGWRHLFLDCHKNLSLSSSTSWLFGYYCPIYLILYQSSVAYLFLSLRLVRQKIVSIIWKWGDSALFFAKDYQINRL